jgi:hypothetical protein
MVEPGKPMIESHGSNKNSEGHGDENYQSFFDVHVHPRPQSSIASKSDQDQAQPATARPKARRA